MPLQNRVDPFGMIVAEPARGMFMGNRGCLHDATERPLRHYQGRRWIICVLDFKGRKRSPMPPGQYTALFFLDEATALAAGHRPCAECQRERFTSFRAHWAAANSELPDGEVPLVDTIDTALHRERLSDQYYQRDKIKRTYTEQLEQLPDGTFVVLDAGALPYLVLGEALFPWSFAGYGHPIARSTIAVQVLTPRSTVQALVHGYHPIIHPSARPPTSTRR